jgi:3'(2'), 5'-bisphosphate nucleotidase
MPYKIENLLNKIVHISEHAGHKIMEVYSREFDITHKEDNTPLTEADMAAHNLIVSELKALTPNLPILSEESTKKPFAERSKWDRYWLVDPLDGTREFIKRNGEFTVNIALIDMQHPVLGVIYVPVTGVCYLAQKGNGAYKSEPNGDPVQIHTRKTPSDVKLVMGSRSHRGDSLNQFLNKIGSHEIICRGSSLKSCIIAEGNADIYPRLGPTSEWDTAAAQCIVEEAGGMITDTQMSALCYNQKDSLLNPHFLVIGDKTYDWAQYL